MKARNVLVYAFATMAYFYSLAIAIFYFAFMMPKDSVDVFPHALVPFNIYRPATVAFNMLPAWATNSALLALFCLPHSFLALDTTKSSMNLPKVFGPRCGPRAAPML
jgi:hypothetical protein